MGAVDDLEPCPLCGGAVEFSYANHDRFLTICCRGCGMNTGAITFEDQFGYRKKMTDDEKRQAEKTLAKQWNNRPVEDVDARTGKPTQVIGKSEPTEWDYLSDAMQESIIKQQAEKDKLAWLYSTQQAENASLREEISRLKLTIKLGEAVVNSAAEKTQALIESENEIMRLQAALTDAINTNILMRREMERMRAEIEDLVSEINKRV